MLARCATHGALRSLLLPSSKRLTCDATAPLPPYCTTQEGGLSNMSHWSDRLVVSLSPAKRVASSVSQLQNIRMSVEHKRRQKGEKQAALEQPSDCCRGTPRCLLSRHAVLSLWRLQRRSCPTSTTRGCNQNRPLTRRVRPMVRRATTAHLLRRQDSGERPRQRHVAH